MFTYVLIIHIGGAAVSFLIGSLLVGAALRNDGRAMGRHTSALVACMAFDGVTGAALAIIAGTPTIGVCDNIALYVAAFVGVVLFGAWYPSRFHGAGLLRTAVARPLLAGSVLPFVPALAGTLLGY